MIELKGVNKIFNAGTANAVHALHDTNLKIERGEFVVVIGSNGSGKSTLLNVIAGNIFADSGEINIEGKKVNQLKDFERSKWIARIFQNPLLGTAPDLSILDNFRLASLRTKKKILKVGIDKKFKETVKEKISLLQLGLENKLDRMMGSLSGGQRQALTLCMAVMDDAKILLMDEPAAALDPKTSETLMHNAEKLINMFNLTTLLITHHIKDAQRFGNRILQMNEGKIIRDIPAQQKSPLSVNEIYGWFDS